MTTKHCKRCTRVFQTDDPDVEVCDDCVDDLRAKKRGHIYEGSVVNLDGMDRTKLKGLSNIIKLNKSKWQKAFDKDMTASMRHMGSNPHLFDMGDKYEIDLFARDAALELLRQMNIKFDNKRFETQAVEILKDAFYEDND
jgi:hypothetical protein